MADEIARRDANRETATMGVTNDSNKFLTELRLDPTTLRLLVAAAVTSVDHGKSIKSLTGTASSSGDNTIISAVTSKRLKVCSYALFTASTSAVTCTFKDGAAGTALWTVPLQALASTQYGANLAVPAPAFLFGTSAGTLLNLNLSGAISVVWSVSYYDDDAT